MACSAGEETQMEQERAAQQWWARLDHTARQRVRQHRDGYLPPDLLQSLTKAGVLVAAAYWPETGSRPDGFPLPEVVEKILRREDEE